MAKSVSFSVKETQIVPDIAKRGWSLRLEATAASVEEGQKVPASWQPPLDYAIATAVDPIEVFHGGVALINGPGDIHIIPTSHGAYFLVFDLGGLLRVRSTMLVAPEGFTIGLNQVADAGQSLDLSLVRSKGGPIAFTLMGSNWYFDAIAETEYQPPPVQHDFGAEEAIALSAISGVQAHLEGGPGFSVEGNSLSNGWFGAILNTTDLPQAFAFSDCTAFIRDGSPIVPAESPVEVAPNSTAILQMVQNGGANYLQIIPIGSVPATLSKITLDPIDALAQTEWRSALGVTQAIAAALSPGDIVGVLNLASDRYVFRAGVIYGVRRLVEADVISYSDRVGIAPATNPYRALNGKGDTSLWSASFQWLDFTIAATNIWSIRLSHRNGDAGGNRKLKINSSLIALETTIGDKSYVWESPGALGFTPVTIFGYKEDWVRTAILDLKVMMSDGDGPSVLAQDGSIVPLVVGDYFRLASQGTNTLLRYDGIDPASKSWKATPVAGLTAFDSELTIGSTNAIQNNAVAIAIANLLGTAPEEANSLGKIWSAIQSAIAELRSLIEIDPPKLILLDELAEVTAEGDRSIQIRVYIDDN